MKTLKVLVADDEAPARQRLRELVSATPGLRLTSAVGDGARALAAIRDDPPDIVILDIRMPGADGIEVARLLERDGAPEVIFVTAYQDHALDAFDVGAVDYLLKPFDDGRFAAALERCRARIRRRRMEAAGAEIGSIFQEVDPDGPGPGADPPPVRRLALEHRGRKVLVDVEDVSYLRADGSYVEVHTDERSYLLRERLKALDRRLARDDFCRIHRSIIVRLDRIRSLEERGRGDLTAHLHDGTSLPVSRTRREELEERLGTL